MADQRAPEVVKGMEMRSEEEIRQRLSEIKADERLAYKPARVYVNAPLALIQVEGTAVVQALEWVLGIREGCAHSYARGRDRG